MPDMFRVWTTKHVSHFCATNRQLSRIDCTTKNVCPSCGCEDESPSHITKCLDPGRTKMFVEGVGHIVAWLEMQNTGKELLDLIESYLLGRGSTSLTALLGTNSALKTLAHFHDRLGWDCFLEGRVCSLWVQARHQEIQASNSRFDADYWGRGLI